MDQLSTEPLAGATPPAEASLEACANCGATLASDQRYCLQCGERRFGAATFPQTAQATAAPAAAAAAAAAPSAPPAEPPGWRSDGAGRDEAAARNGGLLLLAGVGLLLLSMGIGVLIGRSGAKQAAAPAQVVTIGSATGGSGGGEEAAFSDDWPSGKKGFTVQLQTLPESGTSKSSVEQAKSAASAKGASAVGALLSSHFASLAAGSYVIYSGVYAKKAEAQKALAGLKGKFAGAKVIQVSEASAAGGSSKEGAGSSGSGSGSGGGGSLDKPAPPSSLEGVSKAHGKSYEEQSSKLPDVVSTG